MYKKIGNIVIDIGKSNTKIFLFNEKNQIINSHFKNFKSKKENNILILDTDKIWEWVCKKINLILKSYTIKQLIPTCHGSAIAFISKKEKLLFGIIDYESNLGNIEKNYKKILPSFNETLTPLLDKGLNLGKQIFFINEKKRSVIKNTKYILTYPQYWNWKLCGKYCSEISYLGCHTHLWNFKKNTYSSLLKKMNLQNKFPKFLTAGKQLGSSILNKNIKVLNGIHDSNASYLLFKNQSFKKFTLISSGTWFVIINNAAKKNILKPLKDMLANIDIFKKALPTIRFMGGREFDFLCKKMKINKNYNLKLNKNSFSKINNNLISPSFTMSGPFGEKKGKINNFSKLSLSNRYIHVCLYIAFMTNYCLDLISSKNNIIIEGPLSRNKIIIKILSALRKKQKIYTSFEKYGTAIGASQLFNSIKRKSVKLNKIKNFYISNITLYYDDWLNKVGG